MNWIHQWAVKTVLTAYADGELPAVEARIVERVLAQDDRCAKEYRELQALNQSLSDWAGTRAPTQATRVIPPTICVAPTPSLGWFSDLYEDFARDPLLLAATVALAAITAAYSVSI